MMSSGDVAHDDHPEYLYCMPVIKTPNDRAAIRAAATSGDLHFFLGSDSAPHSTSAKESARPPVGIFTAPAVLELYAQVFDEENKLENLEKFASLNGAAFYGFPVNEETITLEKNPWTLDSLIETEDGEKLRPFGYDEDPAKRLKINWKLAE
jgi:dihydroorotase